MLTPVPAPIIEKLRLSVVTLFRIALGFLFACHGAASIFGILGGAQTTAGALPAGQWPGWWAALIQLICGVMVLLGLFTQPAALLCSGSMAYAYFTVHQEIHLLPIQNHGEAAAQFSLAFLLIAFIGPGAWAIDNRWLAVSPTTPEPASTADSAATA